MSCLAKQWSKKGLRRPCSWPPIRLIHRNLMQFTWSLPSLEHLTISSKSKFKNSHTITPKTWILYKLISKTQFCLASLCGIWPCLLGVQTVTSKIKEKYKKLNGTLFEYLATFVQKRIFLYKPGQLACQLFFQVFCIFICYLHPFCEKIKILYTKKSLQMLVKA